MLHDEYKTACGGTIKVPQTAKDHLLAHPDVCELLTEVFGQIRLPENHGFLARHQDLGRQVGLSACVPAPRLGMTDRGAFALRINRPRPSRVLVGAEKLPTSLVTVIASPVSDELGTYTLITAWIGPLAPKEPGDAASELERAASLDFWSNNALVYDSEVMGEAKEMTWEEVLAQ